MKIPYQDTVVNYIKKKYHEYYSIASENQTAATPDAATSTPAAAAATTTTTTTLTTPPTTIATATITTVDQPAARTGTTLEQMPSGTHTGPNMQHHNQVAQPQTIYNEQFQQYLDRLEAYDAAEKFNKARPFIFLSLLMWPGVWLYRGMEWHNQRKHQNLQNYINKTFAQAKLIQICIITSALLAATIKKSPPKVMNVNKENK